MKLPIKRLLSFLIDMTIVSIILLPFSIFMVNNNHISLLEQDLSLQANQLLSKAVSINTYMQTFATYLKEYMQEYTGVILINIVLIVFFFIIVPYYKNGQTIGQKLLKIKMTKQDKNITILSLIIRNIIVNGLGFMIFVPLLQPLPPVLYLIALSILGILSIILVITSCFMVLYNKDHLGLQDKLSKSQVQDIEVKKCEN